MAIVTGFGAVPSALPYDPIVALGLMMERIQAREEFQKATLVAPILGVTSLSGVLLVDDARLALDLTSGSNVMNPIGFDAGSGAYPDERVSFASLAFALERRPVGKVAIADIIARNYSGAASIDVNGYVASRLEGKFSAMHAFSVWSKVGAAASYASGFSTSGGDLTSASYKLSTDLLDARLALVKAGRWNPSTMIFSIADNAVNALIAAGNTELLRYAAAVAGTSGQPNDQIVLGFVRHILGSQIKTQIVEAYYTDDVAGTATATSMFSAAWSLTRSEGGNTASAFKTLSFGDLVRQEPERDAGLMGNVVFSDTIYQILPSARPAGAWATEETDAGFLHYGYTVS